MTNDSFMRISMLLFFIVLSYTQLLSQQNQSQLSLDRIYSGKEFKQEQMPTYQWMDRGASYLIVEEGEFGDNIIKYRTSDGFKSTLVSSTSLVPNGKNKSIKIESFTLSDDESKVLIFTESKRVWRSKTKGDYWVFNLHDQSLKRLGEGLGKSSLMFAKFTKDNKSVAYVSDFNIFIENYHTGAIKRLTEDGSREIINGTFDWVYEEEFGCRDGFRWSPDGRRIAYWQLDASNIGTHYMVNNTDSIYAQLIPLQYPKVGQDPSSCRVGLINLRSSETEWIDVPGDPIQNYIPRMQWIRSDLLLIQQINRKQNKLTYWNYNPATRAIKKVYEEEEDTWVDIDYPDVSSSTWGMYDLSLIDDVWVTRMTETDGWRHVYKVNLETGEKVLLTPGQYDVATSYGHDSEFLYFSASPQMSPQRYLWKVVLKGNGRAKRITPLEYQGINTYDLSPNGEYAFHTHSNVDEPPSTHLIRTADHKLIRTYVDNDGLRRELKDIDLGEIRFFKVTTTDDVTIDGRMILPPNFDSTLSYPVLFHVYGEPWGMVAKDAWVGMWDRYIAQQGYIIIDMDNRGTPCLNGSEWRKSIYRKIGVLNVDDQAAAAKEVLKWPFIDANRTAVWGWSGGGSMTLNLMFRYPEIYKTGVSVAPVGNQLLYDNIYQERYMGLPSENLEDFINGSPVTYAHQLEGNLMLIHGTGDDNVHYQNAEVVINELIKHNKQFDMMAYPNRSHGISEGDNTRKHLYSLITRYLKEHVPSDWPISEIKP